MNLPTPKLLCYSLESAIAEKFEAMVKRGTFNSRIKDFYDVWLLSRQFNFQGKKLAEAIRLTFLQRATELQNEIIAFSKEFIDAKQEQWFAFRNRLNLDHAPTSFSEIILAINSFLKPITQAISQEKPIAISWNAPGPWI